MSNTSSSIDRWNSLSDTSRVNSQTPYQIQVSCSCVSGSQLTDQQIQQAFQPYFESVLVYDQFSAVLAALAVGFGTTYSWIIQVTTVDGITAGDIRNAAAQAMNDAFASMAVNYCSSASIGNISAGQASGVPGSVPLPSSGGALQQIGNSLQNAVAGVGTAAGGLVGGAIQPLILPLIILGVVLVLVARSGAVKASV